jgi:hypothetical protein
MQVALEHETQERFVPYVDDHPDGPILIGPLCISMPTALAHIFSDGGFVIAADGLSTVKRADGPKVECKHAKKIFHLPGIDREVACAFVGIATLSNDAGEPAFDFTAEFVKAAQTVRSRLTRDANDFASQICPLVQQNLIAVKRGGSFSRYPSPEPHRLGESGRTMVRIYLDGYFSGQPFRTGIRFYHVDQELAWGPAFHDLGRSYKSILTGSDRVARLLFDTEDPRLDKYRTDACRRVATRYKHPDTVITLEDAIEAARNFIEACSDPVALEIDGKDNHHPIGGRIHIATVTPRDGFRWVPGYEPAAQ